MYSNYSILCGKSTRRCYTVSSNYSILRGKAYGEDIPCIAYPPFCAEKHTGKTYSGAEGLKGKVEYRGR